METVPEVRKASGLWSAGFRMGALLGIPTSLIAIFVVGRIWTSCDVGVNASANSLFLLFVAPFIWIAGTVAWVLLYGAIGRFRRGAAVAVGTVFNLWLLWFVVTGVGAMGSYPYAVCPGNVPPWWPGFIPS
ncbi:hypothetical protein [Streptomyces sp. NBC_00996]|uniref:hypothetical protein n=1 Tax=Streptomyces sp. NBC_00996 TaxID=2903710 RepID=UPI0038684985|nr:hypothetical protein OG390_15630 [Streptomyces sp. NBC_00996]